MQKIFKNLFGPINEFIKFVVHKDYVKIISFYEQTETDREQIDACQKGSGWGRLVKEIKGIKRYKLLAIN